jgi:hypothetical protein
MWISMNCGNHIVVGTVKTIDYVANEFSFINLLVKRHKLGAETFHLGKILSNCESNLFGAIEGTTKMINFGHRLSGEHLGDHRPNILCCLKRNNMRQNMR